MGGDTKDEVPKKETSSRDFSDFLTESVENSDFGELVNGIIKMAKEDGVYE